MQNLSKPLFDINRKKLQFGMVFVVFITGGTLLYLLYPYSYPKRHYLLPFGSPTIQAQLVLSATSDQEGLAHYVEHLTWLPNIGNGARPGDWDSNAWTNNVAIGYWLSGKPEELLDMLQVLSGVFKPIMVSRAFAEEERDVILREYDLRLGDNPDAVASEEMKAFLYKGNAIAASVIGTPEQIRMLSYDEAKTYHDITHLPERAVLVVSGDVSKRELSRAVKKSGFPELTGPGDHITPPPFILATPDTETFTYPLPDAAPRMVWRKVVRLEKPVQFDLLETQTALLTDILNTNLPGGIAGPLRFNAFIAKNFSIGVFPIDEQHIEISLTAESDKGVTFVKLQQAFEASLAASARGIPQASYERVRERFSSYWPDWEDDEETARWMADYTLNRLSELREPLSEKQLRKLDDQLSAADINALLTALAGSGRTAIAFIGKNPAS